MCIRDSSHPDTARLRRQRRVALHVVRRTERRAEIAPGVVEAVDVRSHQADAVLAADFDDFLLPRHVAGLGKARRNEYRARNLFLAAFGDRRGDKLGWNREDRDVDVAGNVLDALVPVSYTHLT